MTDAHSRAAPSATIEQAGLNATEQARLVAALLSGGAFGAGPARVTLLETHISYVFLTGEYAYKLKKAVNLGFLDFSKLSARRFYCEEELRLNRRLAPELYLDVVAITGGVDTPVIGGEGPALEYAVKMREFPQEALASRVLARGELKPEDIDALASSVAGFHHAITVAKPLGAFGLPEEILRAALQNFAQIRPLLESKPESADVDALERWTLREYAARAAAMLRRRERGFVRECHGDLHLGNIALIDGKPVIFDCIEFNKQIRWVDVMSEVAFTAMDLEDRGHPDLGHRFLNAYLEITGDYDGLEMLRFYLVYRAMVRAKIARLRAAQLGADARAAALAEYAGYVELAKRYARQAQPAIVVTHGLSGCGKTTLSQALLELTGTVRIRTDVERKRALVDTGPRKMQGIDAGLYSLQATQGTYNTVLAFARAAVDAGWIAIVDGAFLKRWQRDLFRKLAGELNVPFIVVSFAASEATLRARIERRQRAGRDASDADLAVLDHHLRTQEPLAAEEQADAVSYDAEAGLEEARSPVRWRAVLQRVGKGDSTSRDAVASAPAGADPGLAAKVAFLLQPQSYPEPTAAVMPIETHMSWVFLTDRFAYKLKKPVRRSYLDFSTEALRERNCREEVRLNRRLSDDVYVGTVPLTLDVGGGFRVGGSEHVVDWLVKMRRLPAERMLDRLIREHAVAEGEVRHVVAKLSRFYRAASPIAVTPAAYRYRIAAGIDENLRELAAPRYALPVDLVQRVCARQLRWLDSQAALFDARAEGGCVIEAHGDLRPEHICLEPNPQIIDCLEFSADFRMLDAADELAFLALECERLGAPELRQPIFTTYREVTGDAPPDALLHFYQSYRACSRARIAIWHLDDAEVREPRKWSGQALNYLRLAQSHLELAP